MGKKGSAVRKYLTMQLVSEQGGRCCYCGVRMVTNRSKRNKPEYATLEHVHPKFNFICGFMNHNGKKIPQYDITHQAWENCVAACSSCNHMRGRIDAFIFAEKELWKPENKTFLTMQRKMIAFKETHSMRTLNRMARLCGKSCKNLVAETG